MKLEELSVVEAKKVFYQLSSFAKKLTSEVGNKFMGATRFASHDIYLIRAQKLFLIFAEVEESDEMATAELTSLIARLEAVATRLETAGGAGPGKGASGKFNND